MEGAEQGQVEGQLAVLLPLSTGEKELDFEIVFHRHSFQMEIFKSNKSVLDYIASQSDTYSSEDFEKVGP